MLRKFNRERSIFCILLPIRSGEPPPPPPFFFYTSAASLLETTVLFQKVSFAFLTIEYSIWLLTVGFLSLLVEGLA